jgi:hypothetical protein
MHDITGGGGGGGVVFWGGGGGGGGGVGGGVVVRSLSASKVRARISLESANFKTPHLINKSHVK